MKKIVLAMFVLFSVIACESDDNKQTGGSGNNTPTNIQFTTLAKGNVTTGSAVSPRFYVLRTQTEYNTFKEEKQLLTDLVVDFNINEVIVVFDELKTGGGYAVDVTNISRMDNKLTVKLQSSAPQPDDTAINTQPYHAVRLQKTGLPVVFEEQAPL
ncbi:hypothetical protein AMR72_14375 [Flavobacterium psychrophilum]|nr:hypothetical protein AMR72_14375 [Flavobacterium psychrophilum]AOE53599.1 hypothetical protein ALW18_14365 [Flavobacterium psychrophilum]